MNTSFYIMALSACLGMTPSLSAAKDYPNRPISLIIPYGTGGVSDTTSRVISEVLTRELGQSIVVENKPGAQGVVGAKSASKAAPDGYTAVMMTNSLYSIEFLSRPESHLSVIENFDPVCITTQYPSVVLIDAGLPYQTFSELVEGAKEGPEKVTFAFASSIMKLVPETLFGSAGISVQGVPYKALSEALTDVAAGRVSLTVNDYNSALPYIESGRLRPLLVTTRDRSSHWPDIPSTVEAGLTDIDIVSTQGIFLPKGVPENVRDEFTTALSKALHDEELRNRIEDMGIDVVAKCGSEAASEIEADLQAWSERLERAN